MPNGDSSDQWFLEVNGKKFGPYTMAQINALVRHHEIVGDDRVTAPHLSGKWMTVQEFVSQSDRITAALASSQPGQRSAQSIPQQTLTVPPRPDERTLTSITAPAFHSNEQRKPQSDAVLNLFEILQAARERKTQTPTAATQPAIEMPRPVKSSNGGGLFWIAIPAIITVAVAAWRMTGTPPSAAVAETEAPAKAQARKAAPVTASAPAPKPIVPVRTTAAAASPATRAVTHAPGFAVGRQALKPPSAPVLSDRERERELERERERETERELEREKEQRDEYAHNNAPADSGRYDRDDRRDRSDRSDRSDRGDRGDRLDRSTASAGSPDALPVTGGIPAEPGDFRDRSAPDTSGAENPSYR